MQTCFGRPFSISDQMKCGAISIVLVLLTLK